MLGVQEIILASKIRNSDLDVFRCFESTFSHRAGCVAVVMLVKDIIRCKLCVCKKIPVPWRCWPSWYYQGGGWFYQARLPDIGQGAHAMALIGILSSEVFEWNGRSTERERQECQRMNLV